MRYPPIVAAFGPPAVALVLSFTAGLPSERMGQLGGATQLFGLGVVVWTLARARGPFGVPSWGESADRWMRSLVRRMLRRKPNAVVLTPDPATAGVSVGEATVHVGRSADASAEERLDRLEGEVDRLQEQHRELRNFLKGEVGRLRKAMREDRREWQAKLDALEGKIESVALGDEALHLSGAILFAWGIAFQTWPGWLSGLMN